MSLYIESKFIMLISSRLRNFKQKNTYLWNFSCPICGDSKKNLSKARGYAFQKGNNLFYRCHNCGISIGLGNLIKHIDSSLYKEYLLEKYKSGETNNHKKVIDIVPPKFDKIQKQKFFEHSEWVDKLPDEHFCKKYVKSRLIPEKYHNQLLYTSNFKLFAQSVVSNLDKELIEEKRLVIPYFDENNELIAFTGRALEFSNERLRYVTVRTNESTEKLIYGMDRVDLKKPVKIVEGQIDSLFLENCIASGDSSLNLTAKKINTKDLTLVFDNEPRNKQIVSIMEKSIREDYKIVIWPDTIEHKDINEMIVNNISSCEIEEIISNNTFFGLEAKTRLIFWKKV